MNSYQIIIFVILVLLALSIVVNKSSYSKETFSHGYNPHELFYHLKQVSYFLTKNNIRHWLMYGTLLGGVRQNDIIPYDYDFDVGANVKDADAIMALNSELQKYGYQFSRPHSMGFSYKNPRKRTPIWRVSIKVSYHGKIMGDIYLYHKCDDKFMRRYDPKSKTYFWPKATYPSWFTEKLISVKIRDTYFPAPRAPHILLKDCYGKTLKTPIVAPAQGGPENKDCDYYGGAKVVKLKYLIDYLKRYHLEPRPRKVKVLYIYPLDQKQWIKKNENG